VALERDADYPRHARCGFGSNRVIRAGL
jgi:hypothetical protein